MNGTKKARISELVKRTRASQDHKEFEWLLQTVAKNNPQTVVEIGTWYGYSAQTIYRCLWPSIFVGIENDPTALEVLQKRMNKGAFDFMSLKSTVIRRNSSDPRTVKDVLTALDGKPIDFLFIDGDHSIQGVTRDFEAYLRHMNKKTGIIAFHDIKKTDNPTVDVWQLWEKLKEKYRTEEMITDSGMGTGILYV